MHVHTVRTKYTFGDRVRFASEHNGSGMGEVISIDFNQSGQVCYTIQMEGQLDLYGGIYDDEITLLTDEPDTATPIRA